MLVDRLDQFIVGILVQFEVPVGIMELRRGIDVMHLEKLRILEDIEGDMLPELRLLRRAMHPLQSGESENLHINTGRIGLFNEIAQVIVIGLQKHVDAGVDEPGVQEGAIARNLHDHVGPMFPGGMINPFEDVLRRAAKALHAVIAAERGDDVVLGVHRRGHDDVRNPPRPPQSFHQQLDGGFPQDLHHSFTRQAGRTHPRLDNGIYPLHILHSFPR